MTERDRSFWLFAGRRVLHSAWLILFLVVINFTLIHLAPGNPVHLLAGDSGDEAYMRFVSSKFGLDQPLPVQFLRYLSSMSEHRHSH